jgi:murein DD-endopeptidase MepM/ murein hydrolase activator NlpD
MGCAPILKEGGVVGVYHHVTQGECLAAIADEYGVTVEEIVEANRLSDTSIQAGQTIFIPRPRRGRSPRRAEPSHQYEDVTPESTEGFMWPLSGGEGRVVSRFGPRIDPMGGGNDHHGGIDIDGWKGERVYAAESGVIVYAGSKGDYGNMVMIDHGSGLVTVYAHLSSILVRAGQRVTKGNTVGYVGSSGRSTGSHLHFEIRENGVQVDPETHLPG